VWRRHTYMSDVFLAATAGKAAVVTAALAADDSLIHRAQRGGLYDSRTLLHCAAAKGHAPIVAELLRRGADRGATDKRGATAVALARKAGHEAVVALLEGAAGGGEGGEGGGGGGGRGGGGSGGGGGAEGGGSSGHGGTSLPPQ